MQTSESKKFVMWISSWQRPDTGNTDANWDSERPLRSPEVTFQQQALCGHITALTSVPSYLGGNKASEACVCVLVKAVYPHQSENKSELRKTFHKV